MKNFNLVLALAICVISVSCGQTGSGSKALTTLADSVSYSYGVQIGQDMLKRKVEGINPDILAQGMKDAIAENVTLTEEQMNSCFRSFDAQEREKQEVRNQAYVEEGKEFMAKNGEREDVLTTETGLQYRIIKEGSGASPVATDQVTVHYTGKLMDGTVFDSSVERGEPATFPLNRVIPGWTEGLQLMKVGGKAEFTIPSELGYGPRGAGADIPPNAVLIFEVELLAIGGE